MLLQAGYHPARASGPTLPSSSCYTSVSKSSRTPGRASGVSLRAIQQYEQRGKDVNHAQAISVHLLAQVLRCHTEDLLEA
ncbi:hypothetical protein IV77_GL001137 [Olsenella uli DSM 7084]|nr:hypothetical protein IV77_GL001137 [Olsenella uli DSM 7084]